MIGRIIILCGGILLGGIFMFFAFHYHVVKTDTQHVIVQKQQAQLTDSYVDIRDWDVKTWAAHPNLAASLSEAGHGDLVKRNIEQNLLDKLFRRISGREQPRTE